MPLLGAEATVRPPRKRPWAISAAGRAGDRLALALLTAIITIAFLDVLAGARVLHARDLVHYHHPAKKVLREVVLGGEFPHWNRSISGGQPMAANPAHEVFYPLTWLILLPDYDYAFQLFIVIHLYIAAWAMYALLRSLGLGPPASWFGALSFAIGGVVLSYLTLLPFLASAVWMPLVLLFVRRFLLHRGRRDFALAALFLAVQLVVGEPTTLLQTGILAGLYALTRNKRRFRGAAAVGLISAAAVLVAAVAVLPMIDHAADSVRARGFSFADVTTWSMPPVRVAELAYANVRHSVAPLYGSRRMPFLISIYPGLLATLLALAGAMMRMRGAGVFAACFGLSVLLAMGAHTPLWQLLYDLGLARSIRYPEKFMLMGIFALIVFAAKTLDGLLLAFPRLRRPLWLAPAAVLVAADLATLLPATAKRAEPAYLREPPPLIARLPPHRHRYRLFHHAAWHRAKEAVLPYYRPHADLEWVRRNAALPLIPTAHGVQTVLEVDYDLTWLTPTADFVDAVRRLSDRTPRWLELAASMSNAEARAVYIDPREAFALAGGDRRKLQPVGLLPLPRAPRYAFARRLETIRDAGDFVEKAPRFPLGTAFVQGPSFVPAPGVVRGVRETANSARIEVETAGRAFLVMSVTPHKYWTVTVDGAEAAAVVTNVGYQGVVVPGAGKHVVEMRYRNPLVAAGAAVSLAALLALAFVAVRMRGL